MERAHATLNATRHTRHTRHTLKLYTRYTGTARHRAGAKLSAARKKLGATCRKSHAGTRQPPRHATHDAPRPLLRFGGFASHKMRHYGGNGWVKRESTVLSLT